MDTRQARNRMRLRGRSTGTPTAHQGTHTLRVMSESTSPCANYLFTVNGTASRDTEAEFPAWQGDWVREYPNGTTTCAGSVGGGGGDTYTFEGTIVDLQTENGVEGVYLDGTRVTKSELMAQVGGEYPMPEEEEEDEDENEGSGGNGGGNGDQFLGDIDPLLLAAGGVVVGGAVVGGATRLGE